MHRRSDNCQNNQMFLKIDVFWCFQILSSLVITAYLLYAYAADAKTHMLGGKTNLLESCLGGWIIHVLGGYLWHLGAEPPLSPCPATEHRPPLQIADVVEPACNTRMLGACDR